MTKEELKKIADDIFTGMTIVEGTLTPREFYVNTNCWVITPDQVQRMAAHGEVTAISVEGYHIQLTIKTR